MGMSALRLSPEGLLEVTGSMTAAEVPGLLAGLGPFNGVTQVDLKSVERVDSSALSVLLALSRAAKGATVTVHRAPPALKALGDLYGLQTLFWVV